MLTNQSNLHDGENAGFTTEGKDKAMESEGAGGQNFGRDGKATPMGDDKDNPSQNAGYSNGYFARVAPLDEDTANNNFKADGQDGEPDYDAAHGTNTPGPQEVPDQQKVGGDSEQQESQEQTYKEPGLDDPQPDHGSGSTETGEERNHIET
jgi:hypothetical protein